MRVQIRSDYKSWGMYCVYVKPHLWSRWKLVKSFSRDEYETYRDPVDDMVKYRIISSLISARKFAKNIKHPFVEEV